MQTPAAAIAAALDAIDRAYWQACDSAGRAVDPADLGAPDGLLDDAHDAALKVEGVMQSRGISWPEARDFV